MQKLNERTLTVRRIMLSVIALPVLVTFAWSLYAMPSQDRSSPTWIEVYSGPPRISCSQGGNPPHELVNVPLWPAGLLGVKLMQEKQLHLPDGWKSCHDDGSSD